MVVPGTAEDEVGGLKFSGDSGGGKDWPKAEASDPESGNGPVAKGDEPIVVWGTLGPRSGGTAEGAGIVPDGEGARESMVVWA